MDKMLDEASS